jgi:hypothetical protein
MSRQSHVIDYVLAVSAFALAFSVSAQAGATRTFVSTTGNDSNTSANCGPLSPCRTFTAALSVTNAGGEIVVLTSGGYGPATISQPVIITAIGVDASISVTTSGGAGLTVKTPGNVTLIGLNLHGEGTGLDGILVQQVGFLRLYNMLIENFLRSAVSFQVSGNLAIYGSRITDGNTDGLIVNNPSANVYVQDTSFDHIDGAFAVNVVAGQVTVADSSAEYNNFAFEAQGGTLTLFNDRVSFNATGLDASGGVLYFAKCLIANNATAYSIEGGTMAGTSAGTTLIAPGQATSGALSTPIALQ